MPQVEMDAPAAGLAPQTIPGVLQSAARRFGEAACVLVAGRQIGFDQALRDVRAAAAGFLAAHIGAGDVVAIWAPNEYCWIVAAIGAQWVGAAITPLNTRLKGREAADILRRSRAKALVCARAFLATDYPSLIAQADLPELRLRISLTGDPAPGYLSWEEFVASGRAVPGGVLDAALNARTPDEVSDIIFTSGTTGEPKGALCTQGATVALVRAWIEAVDLRQTDRYLLINPFFHTFGYKVGWLASLIVGCVMLPVTSFNARQMISDIERERVSFLPGAPTIFQTLLAEVGDPPPDFSSLRVAVTGAATVPPSLIEQMQTRLGFKRVITGYGMTECPVISMCREGDRVETIAQSCGRAIPGLEVRCVDDLGEPVPSGENGEIWVRGYGIMRGYLDDPAATQAAIDPAGWLHTGDVGTLDEAGYLRITDRKKEMYITGGFNCYPAEIEKLLSAHPAIAMAAVVGVPDARLGEVGHAFIVRKPGGVLTQPELVAWARQNMANYKIPARILFVPELPIGPGGKIVRHLLRAQAIEAA